MMPHLTKEKTESQRHLGGREKTLIRLSESRAVFATPFPPPPPAYVSEGHSFACLPGHFLRVQWQRHGGSHLLPRRQPACPQPPGSLPAQESFPAAEGRGWHQEHWGPRTHSLGLVGSGPGLRWGTLGSPPACQQPGPTEQAQESGQLAKEHLPASLSVSLGLGSGSRAVDPAV